MPLPDGVVADPLVAAPCTVPWSSECHNYITRTLVLVSRHEASAPQDTCRRGSIIWRAEAGAYRGLWRQGHLAHARAQACRITVARLPWGWPSRTPCCCSIDQAPASDAAQSTRGSRGLQPSLHPWAPARWARTAGAHIRIQLHELAGRNGRDITCGRRRARRRWRGGHSLPFMDFAGRECLFLFSSSTTKCVTFSRPHWATALLL